MRGVARRVVVWPVLAVVLVGTLVGPAGASDAPRVLTSTTAGPGTSVVAIDMLSPSFGYGVAGQAYVNSATATHRSYLVATSDLGDAWRVVAPLPPDVTALYESPNIDFVNRRVGYVQAPQGAIEVTSDAGASWSRVSTPGVWPTFEVEGATLAVVSDVCAPHQKIPSYGPLQCPSVLSTYHLGSTVATTTESVSTPDAPWRAASLLAGVAPSTYVLAEDNQVGPGRRSILVTDDAGRTWRDAVDPCPGLVVQQVLTAGAHDWLAFCWLDGGMSQGAARLSSSADQGATWTTVSSGNESHEVTGSIGDGDLTLALSGNHQVIFAGADNPAGGVVDSADGGRRWTRVATNLSSGGAPEFVATFGATGAIVGVVGGPLVRTVDGVQWSTVSSLPAGRYEGRPVCSAALGVHAKSVYSDDQDSTYQYVVTFTNGGATSCYLNGWPGAHALAGRHGPPVDEPTQQMGSFAPYVTLLAHGGTASLLLYVNAPPKHPSTTCRVRTIAAVRLSFGAPAVFDVAVGPLSSCAGQYPVYTGHVVSGVHGAS